MRVRPMLSEEDIIRMYRQSAERTANERRRRYERQKTREEAGEVQNNAEFGLEVAGNAIGGGTLGAIGGLGLGALAGLKSSPRKADKLLAMGGLLGGGAGAVLGGGRRFERGRTPIEADRSNLDAIEAYMQNLENAESADYAETVTDGRARHNNVWAKRLNRVFDPEDRHSEIE